MLKRSIIFGLLLCLQGGEAFSQAKPAAPAAKVPQEDPPPAMAVPQGYKNDMKGRRDPFINPVPKPIAPEPEIPVVRPPGLKGLLLAEAVLKGIIASKEPDMSRAIISAPGGKVYFVKAGESLFDAVVKEIKQDGVVFELRSRDREGRNTVREVTRTVRSTP